MNKIIHNKHNEIDILKNLVFVLEDKLNKLEIKVEKYSKLYDYNINDEINLDLEIINKSIPSIITNNTCKNPPKISRQYAFEV